MHSSRPVWAALGARRLRTVAHRATGQSLVEFAITLPLLLLIVTGAIDLGRAYLTTINMQNAAKEGAFFGARYPGCDTDAAPGCADPQTVQGRVELELDGITSDAVVVGCFAPGTTDFAGSGKALSDCVDGDLYRVTVSATFRLATPLVGAVVGDSLALTASATSVVLTSFAMADGPIDPGGPGGTPLPTLAPGECEVPDFANGTRLNQAQDVWSNVAGFETSASTIGPGGQDITWQSLPAGYVGPCASVTIVVSNVPQATPTPSPTPSPTPQPTPTPTPAPSTTPAPTATPAATPTPSPTPDMCTVPQLVVGGRDALAVTAAQGAWRNAGFRSENFAADRPPNSDYDVKSQTVPAGQSRPCLTTSITVSSK